VSVSTDIKRNDLAEIARRTLVCQVYLLQFFDNLDFRDQHPVCLVEQNMPVRSHYKGIQYNQRRRRQTYAQRKTLYLDVSRWNSLIFIPQTYSNFVIYKSNSVSTDDVCETQMHAPFEHQWLELQDDMTGQQDSLGL
jgi:hypothetical protein